MSRGNSNKITRKYINTDSNGYYLYSYFEGETPEEFMMETPEGFWLNPNQNTEKKKFFVYPACRFDESELKVPYFPGTYEYFPEKRIVMFSFRKPNGKKKYIMKDETQAMSLLVVVAELNLEDADKFIYLGKK